MTSRALPSLSNISRMRYHGIDITREPTTFPFRSRSTGRNDACKVRLFRTSRVISRDFYSLRRTLRAASECIHNATMMDSGNALVFHRWYIRQMCRFCRRVTCVRWDRIRIEQRSVPLPSLQSNFSFLRMNFVFTFFQQLAFNKVTELTRLFEKATAFFPMSRDFDNELAHHRILVISVFLSARFSFL